MEINFALLQKYNPWWEETDSINQDERILDFEKQEIKYRPEFLKRPFSTGVYTLIGPRQVGKSTAIKLFIQDLLLRKRMNPKRIFFFQCDIIENYQDLARLIEVYLETLSSQKNIYIFLDEISFVKEWPRAIKHLIDRGDLKKAIVFLTGSLSLQIKGGAEFLPGRRGKKEKQDFLLLPLNFLDYLLVQKQTLPLVDFDLLIKEKPSRLIFNPGLNKIWSQRAKIESLFKEYLLSGGFLLSLNELKKTKKISDNTYRIYWQWIRGDLLKVERKETIFLEIIQETIKHLGSTLSYNALAKNVSIRSHLTVMDYLDLSQKFFILNIFHNINLTKRLPALRKQKKVTFLDPFLFHLLNGQILGGINFFATAKEEINKYLPVLIEGIVSSYLKEKFLRSGFWHNKKEVDFVGLDKNQTIGFEIKIRERINDREIAALKTLNQFQKIIIISKNEFREKQGMLIIPYWMMLLTR